MLERHELAVDAQRRRTSDLQVQVGRVALDHLLQDRLEVECRSRRGPAGAERRRCVGLAIRDRSGRGPARTRRAARSAARISLTTPEYSDSISFMIFIASMMQSDLPLRDAVADRDVRLRTRLRRA